MVVRHSAIDGELTGYRLSPSCPLTGVSMVVDIPLCSWWDLHFPLCLTCALPREGGDPRRTNGGLQRINRCGGQMESCPRARKNFPYSSRSVQNGESP